MKISVIVPIYNVENYIEECLDSLLKQNLSEKEYEIICIDDGSTDRSGRIAEEYGKKYEQIKVIRQKNGGLSKARNRGLKAARGEYLCFVDSDDYLEPGGLDALYAIAVKHDLDKLMYGYQRFEDGKRRSCGEHGQRGIKEDNVFFFPNALKMDTSKIVPDWKVAWNYLIKSSIVKQYDLQFVEGVLFEDEEFNFWLNHCVGFSGYIDQKLYHYRIRNTGILHTYKDDGIFLKYIRGRCKLALHHRKALRDFIAGNLPEFRIPLERKELERRIYTETKGILSQLISKADIRIFRRTLVFLKKRKLYPYPMRFYRQNKGNVIRQMLVSAITFLYPKEWYLWVCIWIAHSLKSINVYVKQQ